MKFCVRTLLIILTLGLFACQQRQNDNNEEFISRAISKNFWVSDSIKWELPPLDDSDTTQPKIYYGYGGVYYFINDSSLRIVKSYLQKQNDTIIFCTEPEESLFEGTWKIENDKIIFITHLAHQNALPQLVNTKTGKVDTNETIKHYTQIHYDTLNFASNYLVGNSLKLKPTVITSDTSNSFYKLFYEDWEHYRECFKRDLIEGGVP